MRRTSFCLDVNWGHPAVHLIDEENEQRLPFGHEQINSPRPSIHRPPCRQGELEHSSTLIWQRSPENAGEQRHDSRLSSTLMIQVPLFKHLFWQRFDTWKPWIKARRRNQCRWSTFESVHLRNKTRVARSPRHMMIIVVYVFDRQQTLRTNKMSLISNKFQFISRDEWHDEFLFLLSLSLSVPFSLCHLFDAQTLAGQIVLVYRRHIHPSIVFLFLSFSVVARRRRGRRRVKTKTHWVIIWTMNDRNWNVHPTLSRAHRDVQP